MDLKGAVLLILVILISGCAFKAASVRHVPDDEKVRTFAEIYRRAKEAGFETSSQEVKLTPDIGLEKPYVPVYAPPSVIKVWIPAHVSEADKDVLVAGHWSFVVLTRAHWFIEDEYDLMHQEAVTPKPPQKLN